MDNAAVCRALFGGSTGPVRDAVLLNAAAAVAAHTGFSGDSVADVRAAGGRVAEALDSGAAEALLTRWAEYSTSLRRTS